ncbi:MAG: hypothetical protein IT196_16555 [Acidimicrobiales bacterium]|nr:hypothetical protein [Acidimicrobiales bacterium]
MTQCSYETENGIHGKLRCAAQAVERGDRCLQHRRGARAAVELREGEPETLLVVDGDCLMWEKLVQHHEGRRGKRASELFAAAPRPLAWSPSLGLWVDLVALLFLQDRGYPRPPGTYQRCRRVGCVNPAHAREPERRLDVRRVDLSSRLDQRFGMSAA